MYKLDVKGSKDSQFPKIYEVLAVGIGATNKEFLKPCNLIYSFKLSQSYSAEGLTSQRSNYNFPKEAGDPLKVS